MRLQQTVAFLQRDRNFSVSALMQCGKRETAAASVNQPLVGKHLENVQSFAYIYCVTALKLFDKKRRGVGARCNSYLPMLQSSVPRWLEHFSIFGHLQ